MPAFKDISLCLFAEDNAFRKQIVKVAQSSHFDNCIIFCILISSTALVFESPVNDPDSLGVQIMAKLDYFTTVIFTIEAMIKIIATGFLFNGPKSYMLLSTNVLDFIIVVPSVLSLIFDAQLDIFKIIRMIRLMRPLRFIGRNDNLKESLKAILQSLPSIGSLLAIVMFVMFIAAIFAV